MALLTGRFSFEPGSKLESWLSYWGSRTLSQYVKTNITIVG